MNIEELAKDAQKKVGEAVDVLWELKTLMEMENLSDHSDWENAHDAHYNACRADEILYEMKILREDNE